jgi:exodeoxyribonuclease VII large subunit
LSLNTPSFSPFPEESLPPRFTVTELVRSVDEVLSEVFPSVLVEGEISNVKLHRSGHLYFVLKDEESQLRGVMFRSDLIRLPYTLEDGMKIVVFGQLRFYERKGEISLIARRIEPLGIGALLVALRQLKEKLEKEGLFDPSRKRPLPFYPKEVGVVTSPQGAALFDILKVSRRRHPGIPIRIAPSRVQGPGAELEVVKALDRIYKEKTISAIILARGGGSQEDLWTFNTEMVVRKVVESPVPIVSAIGHEVDYTLTDLAADVRAPTPSAAAEMVFPNREELLHSTLSLKNRISTYMEYKLLHREKMVSTLKKRIPTPKKIVEFKIQRWEFLKHRLTQGFRFLLTSREETLARSASMLQGVNPLRILEKGYVYVTDLSSKPIGKLKLLKVNDFVYLHFRDGKAKARIEEIEEKNSS